MPAHEARDIRRELAEARPDAFRPDLAMSLNNLGNRYSALGRRAEALEAYREAISTLAPYFDQYADALAHNMGIMVRGYLRVAGELGREPDAELLGPILAHLEKLLDDREAE